MTTTHKFPPQVYHKHNGLCPRVRSRHYAHLPGSLCPPPAREMADLRQFVFPMLRLLGPFAHRDPVLIIKTIRLLKMMLGIRATVTYDSEVLRKEDLSQNAYYYDVFTMLDEVFLPSLALTPANCCLAEEIWSLIRHFPYEHRYRLYDGWKVGELH